MKIISGYKILCADCGINVDISHCFMDDGSNMKEEINLCKECMEKRENDDENFEE